MFLHVVVVSIRRYSYLRLVSFVFIQLRVHDRSSHMGQDLNPVHSPPMIELGLEGQLTCGEFDFDVYFGFGD